MSIQALPPHRATMNAAPQTSASSGDPALLEVRVKRGSLVRRVTLRLTEWARTLLVRRRIRSLGDGVRLVPPIHVYGGEGIRIGKGVCIWQHARLIAHNTGTGRGGTGGEGEIKLDIGDGAAIHPYAHISAIMSVRIGPGALFASNVYISDHDHDWRDPNDPPITNGRVLASPVEIGANVWLGERVCVLRGVTIGEGSIVGAGSVVTKSIPPRSIAVGAPARVIRRWDEAAHRWVPVD